MTDFNPRGFTDNRLVTILVIGTETVLCGAIYLLMRNIFQHRTWVGMLKLGSPEGRTAIVLMLCYAVCAVRNGVVLHSRNVHVGQVLGKVAENLILFAILSFFAIWIGHFADVFSCFMALYWVVIFFLFVLFRVVLMKAFRFYRKKQGHSKSTVLVGSSTNNQDLYREMSRGIDAPYSVSGYFDDEPNPDFPDGCPWLGRPEDVIPWLRTHGDVHHLFCCLPSRRADIIVPIIEYCENNLVHFFSVPNVHNYLNHNMCFNMLGNVPFLSLRDEPLERAENRALKRVFDIVVSAVFLCTVFLVVLVIVTIVTKLTMPGPVFFVQKRNGMNGKVFKMLKFRSMKVNKDADTLQAQKGDPRVTKWGSIMRRTNIDELPQFINVFLGQMSIVGPRPHMLLHTEEYSHLVDKYMVRHFVKPGVTGWSQVIGCRGETREVEDMAARVKGDIWYIEHWSFGLDLYIILRTIINIFVGEENAY